MLSLTTTPTPPASIANHEVCTVLNHSEYPDDQTAEPGGAHGRAAVWLDVVSLLFILLVVSALLMMQ